jgi:hypothetical protein
MMFLGYFKSKEMSIEFPFYSSFDRHEMNLLNRREFGMCFLTRKMVDGVTSDEPE